MPDNQQQTSGGPVATILGAIGRLLQPLAGLTASLHQQTQVASSNQNIQTRATLSGFVMAGLRPVRSDMFHFLAGTGRRGAGGGGGDGGTPGPAGPGGSGGEAGGFPGYAKAAQEYEEYQKTKALIREKYARKKEGAEEGADFYAQRLAEYKQHHENKKAVIAEFDKWREARAAAYKETRSAEAATRGGKVASRPDGTAGGDRVFLDTETSGLGKDAYPYQIAAKKYDPSGKEVGSFNRYIDPPPGTPRGNLPGEHVHGLRLDPATGRMQKKTKDEHGNVSYEDVPTVGPESAARDLDKFLKGAGSVGGHNFEGYDNPVLQNFLHTQAGHAGQRAAGTLQSLPHFDTLKQAQKMGLGAALGTEGGSNSLPDLLAKLDPALHAATYGNAGVHDALKDVTGNAAVAAEIARRGGASPRTSSPMTPDQAAAALAAEKSKPFPYATVTRGMGRGTGPVIDLDGSAGVPAGGPTLYGPGQPRGPGARPAYPPPFQRFYPAVTKNVTDSTAEGLGKLGPAATKAADASRKAAEDISRLDKSTRTSAVDFRKKQRESWDTLKGSAGTTFLAGASLATSALGAASPDATGLIAGSAKLLAAAFGQSLIPAAVKLSGWLQQLAFSFHSLAPATKTAFAVVSGGTLAAGAGMLAFGRVLGGVNSVLGLFGASITAAQLGLAGLQVAFLAAGYVGHKAVLARDEAERDARGRKIIKDGNDPVVKAILADKTLDQAAREKKLAEHVKSLKAVDAYGTKWGTISEKLASLPFFYGSSIGVGVGKYADSAFGNKNRQLEGILGFAGGPAGWALGGTAKSLKDTAAEAEARQVVADNALERERARREGRAPRLKEVPLTDDQKEDRLQQGRGILASFSSMKGQAAYTSIDEAYKRVQLGALGDDPLTQTINKWQRESLAQMLKQFQQEQDLGKETNEWLKHIAGSLGSK